MNSALTIVAWVVLMVSWFAWAYPFIFRAPHQQKRASVTMVGPTRAGLFLECTAIFLAFTCHAAADAPPSALRLAGTLIFGPIAALLSWSSVRHLGRQFRITAGLYEDHELVTTGPYAIVRHPIYASLLAILAATLSLLTPWQWALLSLALFVAGTEIRVATEDGLLASRFGNDFEEYRKRVKAYVPGVR
jgi:protein-S-isoprenylcysteine O-methyltransferase Ste14